MPDEPLNNSQESPDDNFMGESQVNNIEVQTAELTDANPEIVADAPAETVIPKEPQLENVDFPANPIVEEAPAAPLTETDMEINTESTPAEPITPQVEESSESAAPFVAPESLPVQSTGSEPTLPPSSEQPKKKSNMVLWLALAIVFVALAVAGYFLAKYLL